LENIPNVNLPPTFVNAQWSYFYGHTTQNLTIPVVIKKKADFELVGGNNSTLAAGQKKGELKATYKNIGDDPVKDAIARLSIFQPFSSTDDQAYIGTLDPQEAKTVTFRIDVDSDATPKDYGINSEIKYTDVNGDSVISESMKIPVVVTAASQSLLLPVIVILVILGAAGWYVYKRKRKLA
jgi:LPXTG-motif cell wall-anchored protein